MPKVSVIVPVYNLENYIERTVNVLLNQTLDDLEIILINDGSKDNSGKICDALMAKDSRISVLHTENRGVSAARNAGIRLARGKYIGFCDGDDIPNSEMYEILYNFAEKNRCQVVTAQTTVIHDDGTRRTAARDTGEFVWDSPDVFMKEFLKGTFGFGVCKMLFCSELAKTVEYEEGKKINEDKLYVFQALQKTQRMGFIDKSLFNYYRRTGSASFAQFSPKFFDAIYFAEKINATVGVQYPDLTAYSKAGLARAHIETLKLMVLENGKNQFKKEWTESVRFLRGLDRKFCKTYLPKNDYIKWSALKINQGCFSLAVKAFSKN